MTSVMGTRQIFNLGFNPILNRLNGLYITRLHFRVPQLGLWANYLVHLYLTLDFSRGNKLKLWAN
jgi:hypothetical protein